MAMLAEIIDAVVGVDTHRDTHTAHLVNPIGGTLGELTFSNSTAGFKQLLTWIGELQPGPRLVLRSKAPAVMASGWPGMPPRPGCTWSRSNSQYGRSAGVGSPIRLTPGWQPWPCCDYRPTGSPAHAPMVTGRRCASCCPPVISSPA